MPTTSSAVDPALGISDIMITEEMVRKKLATVHQDKAGEVDDILPKLLANIQNEISYLLWMLFCKSMLEGAVPEDWRRASVTLVFKNGIKEPQRITGQSASPVSAVSCLRQ